MISRITFFDFIVGITLGSIAVRIALGSQESPFLAAISASVITILVVITDLLDIKSTKFRKLIDGDPITLISNGKLMDRNLKSTNHNEQWVREQVKTYNISDVKEVFYAGLNAAGILYVSKKQSI